MLGEYISCLAKRPGNSDGMSCASNGRTGSRYEADFVVTAVNDRAGQFVEACIKEHELFVGHLLDGANLGDEKPGVRPIRYREPAAGRDCQERSIGGGLSR